jgi:NAD(P)-dependent dehydrogenase (short-subunit alcohol dehydrogenase family)
MEISMRGARRDYEKRSEKGPTRASRPARSGGGPVSDSTVERVWVVTGASRGIGAAIAREAAAGGAVVACVARSAEVEGVARGLGGGSVGVRCDLADPAAAEAAVSFVVGRYGRVDVLVNNAGIHRGGRLEQLDRSAFAEVVRTNLEAPFELCRLVVPHMPAGGAIVNVGAVVGFRGFPGDSPYGASKAGLAGLTKVLAVELAPRGITVNLVVPGLTETEILAGVSERAQERLVARIPLGRMAQADEIAGVVRWVAQTPYMTGAVVAVDGGISASL